MDIHGLADGAGVLRRLIGAPGGPGDNPTPALLPVVDNLALVAHHRLSRRGVAQRVDQPLQTLGAQDLLHPGAVHRVHHRLLQSQPVCAPGVQRHHRRLNRVLKLNLLAHGGEEAVLHPLMLQQLQCPLRCGELFVVVHLLGHGAHIHQSGALLAAVLQQFGQLRGQLQ